MVSASTSRTPITFQIFWPHVVSRTTLGAIGSIVYCARFCQLLLFVDFVAGWLRPCCACPAPSGCTNLIDFRSVVSSLAHSVFISIPSRLNHQNQIFICFLQDATSAWLADFNVSALRPLGMYAVTQTAILDTRSTDGGYHELSWLAVATTQVCRCNQVRMHSLIAWTELYCHC